MAGLNTKETGVVAVVAALTALAGVAHYGHWSELLAFGLATLALAGLAWMVALGTEQLGARLGPAATGVLQSTLGNLPELFVVLFALRAGKLEVARFSIVGSILANALLVLGVTIVAGAWKGRDRMMRFNPRLPNDTATLLLLSVFIIVLVGIGLSDGGHLTQHLSQHLVAVSVVASLCLLVVYVSWLVPYVRSEPAVAEAEHARVPLATSLAILAISGAGSAFVSDWFVSALTPAMGRLHLSDAFAGLVIVAIAGNAVENVTAVFLAAKQQSDLAVSVVKNSVAQIAAFLFPVLILLSLFFATHLTFALPPLLIAALALSAIAVWQITGDGEAAIFEGLALIALYVVIGAITLYAG